MSAHAAASPTEEDCVLMTKWPTASGVIFESSEAFKCHEVDLSSLLLRSQQDMTLPPYVTRLNKQISFCSKPNTRYTHPITLCWVLTHTVPRSYQVSMWDTGINPVATGIRREEADRRNQTDDIGAGKLFPSYTRTDACTPTSHSTLNHRRVPCAMIR